MYSESAAFYDLIYTSFKDYETETAKLAALIKTICPNARSLLDVGCGTGEHARILSEQFGYTVDGLDIEPEFVRIAQQKNPEGRFYKGNMTDFNIERRFDIVLCLFGTIGYVETLDGLKKALINFKKHLSNDGTIIVEPWFTPETWIPNTCHMTTVNKEKMKLCRMAYSEKEERIARITFDYLVGSKKGIMRMHEVHELGLFTMRQMIDCFKTTGLTPRYDDTGISGRGLYIAKLAV